jgi:hypothetical protein
VLIGSLAQRDIREEQKRRTPNKKQSLPHVLTGLANMPDNSPSATLRSSFILQLSTFHLYVRLGAE